MLITNKCCWLSKQLFQARFYERNLKLLRFSLQIHSFAFSLSYSGNIKRGNTESIIAKNLKNFLLNPPDINPQEKCKYNFFKKIVKIKTIDSYEHL